MATFFLRWNTDALNPNERLSRTMLTTEYPMRICPDFRINLPHNPISTASYHVYAGWRCILDPRNLMLFSFQWNEMHLLYGMLCRPFQVFEISFLLIEDQAYLFCRVYIRMLFANSVKNANGKKNNMNENKYKKLKTEKKEEKTRKCPYTPIRCIVLQQAGLDHKIPLIALVLGPRWTEMNLSSLIIRQKSLALHPSSKL